MEIGESTRKPNPNKRNISTVYYLMMARSVYNKNTKRYQTYAFPMLLSYKENAKESDYYYDISDIDNLTFNLNYKESNGKTPIDRLHDNIFNGNLDIPLSPEVIEDISTLNNNSSDMHKLGVYLEVFNKYRYKDGDDFFILKVNKNEHKSTITSTPIDLIFDKSRELNLDKCIDDFRNYIINRNNEYINYGTVSSSQTNVIYSINNMLLKVLYDDAFIKYSGSPLYEGVLHLPRLLEYLLRDESLLGYKDKNVLFNIFSTFITSEKVSYIRHGLSKKKLRNMILSKNNPDNQPNYYYDVTYDNLSFDEKINRIKLNYNNLEINKEDEIRANINNAKRELSYYTKMRTLLMELENYSYIKSFEIRELENGVSRRKSREGYYYATGLYNVFDFNEIVKTNQYVTLDSVNDLYENSKFMELVNKKRKKKSLSGIINLSGGVINFLNDVVSSKFGVLDLSCDEQINYIIDFIINEYGNFKGIDLVDLGIINNYKDYFNYERSDDYYKFRNIMTNYLMSLDVKNDKVKKLTID